MMERKKVYIMDALGELEDRFVAEAIEYEKKRFSWKYNRELATMAACAAVLFLAVSAYRLLPIGLSQECAAEKEAGQQMVMESVAVEGSSTDAPTSAELTDVKENVIEDLHISKGITWEIVEDAEIAQKDGIHEAVGAGETTQEQSMTSIESTSCTVWLSATEIFALGNDIFMGTVIEKDVYHVKGGMDTYFTVVTVEVEDSIRGEMSDGGNCRIYLPCAKLPEITVTNSLIGDLDKLEVGSRAIFMPTKATAETSLGRGDHILCYADFADYLFGEGMRFMFLETEDGVSYAKDVFEIPGGEPDSLEGVAKYIRDMLKKQ